MKHTCELAKMIDPCGRVLLLGLRRTVLLRDMLKVKGDFRVLATQLVDDPESTRTQFLQLETELSDLISSGRVVMRTSDLYSTPNLIPHGAISMGFLDNCTFLTRDMYLRVMFSVWGKIRGGGVLAGAGYTILNHNVVSAVNEFGRKTSLRIRTTWGDEEPSWFFLK